MCLVLGWEGNTSQLFFLSYRSEFVEKIYYPEFWRDAVPKDATKDPPMTARFTHYPNGFPGNTETVIGLLRGVVQYKSNRNPDWFDTEGNRYVTAQVYDPPVGFEFDTSKYRLIATIEAPRDGDQEFNCGHWVDRPKSCGAFDQKKFYRRLLLRCVAFEWVDRDRLRNIWVYNIDNQSEMLCTKFDQDPTNPNALIVNGISAEELAKSWSFMTTNKPVGK